MFNVCKRCAQCFPYMYDANINDYKEKFLSSPLLKNVLVLIRFIDLNCRPLFANCSQWTNVILYYVDFCI